MLLLLLTLGTSLCVDIHFHLSWVYSLRSEGPERLMQHLRSKALPDCFSKQSHGLDSYEQHVRVPSPPHPSQHLFLSVFFMVAILVGLKMFPHSGFKSNFPWMDVSERLFLIIYSLFLFALVLPACMSVWDVRSWNYSC